PMAIAPPVPVLPPETVWRACGSLAAAITALASSPDGRLLAVGHADGRVTLIQRADGAVAGRLQSGAGPVDRLVFSADSQKLATVSLTGRPLGRATLRPTPNRVLLSPDGTLAAGSLGSDIEPQRWALYSARDGRLLVSSPPARTVGAAYFLPGPRRLLAMTS